MESGDVRKTPVMLDFNGNAWETAQKLASILYTSGWSNYILIGREASADDKALVSLVQEGALAVGEITYTYRYDFDDVFERKAYEYSHRLRKRNLCYTYYNAVNYFSKYEPDIEKTDNGALYYPDINAYVRCGDLSPMKLLELFHHDGCKRVIVFGNGVEGCRDNPLETFHSFELVAPKEYLMKRLEDYQAELMDKYYDAINKLGINDIFPPVFRLDDD